MILQVRDIDTAGDGGVYPLPNSDASGWLVHWEEQDGPTPMALNITKLEEYEVVPGGPKLLTRLPAINGMLYVTDARVAVAVEKFTKGSTWVGFGGVGEAVALVAMGVSAARAAHRRHGKMLVGQVRYQWLKIVAASPAHGGLSSNELRFVVEVKTSNSTRTYRLDVALGYPAVHPLLPAQDIVQRAARYRLSHFPGKPEHHDKLRELTQAPLLAPPAPGKTVGYVMPNFFFMNSKTAYPAEPGTNPSATPIRPHQRG